MQHTSLLRVYKPQWLADPTNKERKTLTGFTARNYERRAYGYISKDAAASVSERGFGWDAIFVNAATNLTNEQYFAEYGKKSARQHAVSDFIETYLRYKNLTSLKHHKLPLHNPVDFGADYFRITDFVKTEKHFSNSYLPLWGIDKLRNAMINEGMFIKAAFSRPVKNAFSPPFGVPVTEKKDDAEETIFMTHDMLHHLICDLICDTDPSRSNFFVYSIWRMCSEACTLVLADMFYADSLIRSGVDRSCVDKRIYPLFEAIKSTQNIPEPQMMSDDDKINFIKKLLYANARYALLGDDNEWRKLLTAADGSISAENLARLNAYKEHFGKFFIGDNAWTRANYDNMMQNKKSLKQWIDNVGRGTFNEANIFMLSDVTRDIAAKNVDMLNYRDMVEPIFNYIFDLRLRPQLQRDKVEFDDDMEIQSRAFRRFLIAQSSLFSRYPEPLNLGDIKRGIFARLHDHATPFSIAEQDEIRKQFRQYVLGVEGLRVMSREEAMNAIDYTPVFPPVYISYPRMQQKYGSIELCVKECIENYNPDVAVKVTRVASTMYSNVARSQEAAAGQQQVTQPRV